MTQNMEELWKMLQNTCKKSKTRPITFLKSKQWHDKLFRWFSLCTHSLHMAWVNLVENMLCFKILVIQKTKTKHPMHHLAPQPGKLLNSYAETHLWIITVANQHRIRQRSDQGNPAFGYFDSPYILNRGFHKSQNFKCIIEWILGGGWSMQAK